MFQQLAELFWSYIGNYTENNKERHAIQLLTATHGNSFQHTDMPRTTVVRMSAYIYINESKEEKPHNALLAASSIRLIFFILPLHSFDIPAQPLIFCISINIHN